MNSGYTCSGMKNLSTPIKLVNTIPVIKDSAGNPTQSNEEMHTIVCILCNLYSVENDTNQGQVNQDLVNKMSGSNGHWPTFMQIHSWCQDAPENVVEESREDHKPKQTT